ncbi:MAG: hypothetical protein ACKOA8_18040 [Deltaproteobacteria bacterium]
MRFIKGTFWKSALLWLVGHNFAFSILAVAPEKVLSKSSQTVTRAISKPAFESNTSSPSQIKKVPVSVLKMRKGGQYLELNKIKNSGWRPDEKVCVMTKLKNKKARVFCGTVELTDQDRTILRLSEAQLPKRRAASVETTTISEYIWPDIQVGVGIALGPDYYFPLANVEAKVGTRFSLGLMPIYLVANGSESRLSASGGFLTGTYYFSRKNEMTGFLGRMGLGYYSLKLTDFDSNESQSSLSLLLNVGFRGNLGLGFNLYAGVGVQEVFRVSGGSDKFSFNGILPVGSLELGFQF